MIVQARMRANGNFSDTSLALLHSVSIKCVMSPRGAVDLDSPLVTHNCLWKVGFQIKSALTFLTGAAAKFKRGHVKRYAVALRGLAVTTLPGTSRSFNPALAVHTKPAQRDGRWLSNGFRKLPMDRYANCGTIVTKVCNLTKHEKPEKHRYWTQCKIKQGLSQFRIKFLIKCFSLNVFWDTWKRNTTNKVWLFSGFPISLAFIWPLFCTVWLFIEVVILQPWLHLRVRCANQGFSGQGRYAACKGL